MTSVATAPRRPGLALLLAALAMFGPFSIDTIFPAFPQMAAQFGASSLAMQQTISVYLIAYAMMSLLHGPLSDSYGRRPVILVGVALFVLASAGCAMSNSLPVLLTFRALQGITAGAGLIVGRAIVRDCYEGAQAQKLMSHITLIFGIAPAIAPIIGGLVLGISGWHAIFWLLAAFAAVLWALCLKVLPETHASARRRPFTLRELVTSYGHILRDRQFLPLALSGTFNFAALFTYIAIAPTFVLDMLHLNQQQFAWLFIPAISGMMLGAIISGRVAGKFSAKTTVNLGYAVMLTGGIANVLMNLFVPLQLPWGVLLIGFGSIGISMSFPTLTLLILDRFPERRGAASSMQAVVSLLFNALLAGAIAPLLARSGLLLAVGALCSTLLGFVTWRWYRHLGKRELAAHSGAAMTEVLEEVETI